MSTTAPRPPRLPGLFMLPRDIGLFLRSARTDAAIALVHGSEGARAAFEAAYDGSADPWASADPRYRYQANKYRVLMSLLPAGRRFGRTLDLGSGVGAMSRMLASVSDDVLGLDIAQSAVERARAAAPSDGGRVRFEQGDITDLPDSLDGLFDLVVVADTVYYLGATDDATLKGLATRVARLVAPGGLCLLANHYFFAADRDSRLSRRIHQAFSWSPAFDVIAQHRRAFYLATLLGVDTQPTRR